MSNARYSLRIIVLKRVLTGEKAANTEDVELWPEPEEGTGRYSARRLSLNAGEEIRTGVKEASTFLKLEVRGQNIDVSAVDRVKVLPGGEVYRITGVPQRDRRVTILTLETL